MTAFDQMPPDAKVWVYAANRKLTSTEQADITSKANAFTDNWTAHQNQLKAAFAILHDVFLVLMVDVHFNEVSGCGIDKSIHFVQQIDREYNINLFNRLQIELLVNDEVILTGKQKLSVMLQEEQVNEQTITFNRNVTDKHTFDTEFRLPLGKSWVYPAIRPVPTS
jgi:hypothetical protein